MSRLLAHPSRDNSPRPPAGEPIVSRFAADRDMSDILDLYVSQLATRLETLRSQLESGRLEAVRASAHQLITSGAAYGFPEISRAAITLESAAQRAMTAADAHPEQIQELRRGLEELAQLCTRARAR